eukprot:3500184-Alexandrium_andersonii.AAC.1
MLPHRQGWAGSDGRSTYPSAGKARGARERHGLPAPAALAPSALLPNVRWQVVQRRPRGLAEQGPREPRA